MSQPLGWTDVEEIGIRLCEAHPQIDPLTVRFTQLREMVQALPDFAPEPGHTVNEQILEAIQAAWHEEYTDSREGDEDEDEPHYRPPSPFRPDDPATG